MGLKETFKKQGGAALLKRYWKGGAFFTAAGEFLLLGKSRTALEILRLSDQLKIKKNLEEKFHFHQDHRVRFVGTAHGQGLLMRILNNG